MAKHVLDATRYDTAQIKGWGIDADPENDPTYPIKRRNNAEHAGYTWERPSQQTTDIEILHSNERPNLSAAFGTSTPPHGLSGWIRRMAFKFSESSYGHWLPLMLADRIGVAEGYIEDFSNGRCPNVFEERGWRAEWQHNRAHFLLGIALRAAVVGVVAGALAAGMTSKKGCCCARRMRKAKAGC